MVNFFDLSAGMAGNRLLTDKPHRHGSPLSRRSQSDVSRMGQFEDRIEEKVMMSELSRTCSNGKSSGTPMKMLIAQEMSKEVNCKHNPPGVVAKLMGLDALPRQPSDLAKQRSHPRCYSRSQSDTPLSNWQHDKRFWDLQMQDEFHYYPQHNEYKDVYEIMQQSPKPNCVRDKSPHKGKCDETPNDRKMALVREKFIEAKRLSTDEKLRQTRQFQDAVEVLNSNKDLFIKFLQEPNSMFSQHLYNLRSISHPPETKRITVLRPCKMVDNGMFIGSAKKNEKQVKKADLVSQVIGSKKSHPGLSSTAVNWKLDENPTQPTRIVVLKPNPDNPQDIKAVVSAPALSPILHCENFIEETEDDEGRKSREVAKEITQQMRENLRGHRRDETLLSSVFSNGYIGDESSFHKSENEYAAGNLSDSEVISPTSRHSWDYVNRFGSPYSPSSFSRASYSPESSVCREAKKRLSERWAMMASNGHFQEQRHEHRSSSTLGEMLALSERKNTERNVEQDAKEDYASSTSKLVGDLNKDEEIDNSPRSLVRSKSVPVSSTVFGIQLNADVPDQAHKKTDVLKEAAKARSGKSSLKGKVSSLFLPRGKKSNKEKSVASQSKEESLPAGTPSDSAGRSHNDGTNGLNDIGLEECSSPTLHQLSCKASSTDQSGKPGIISSEAGFSVVKHLMSGNPSENQDQPSPISVLETPFEEDEHTATESSSNNKAEEHEGLPVFCKPNLIDKSPPIGSIARSLSWDDSCVDTAISYPLKPSFSQQGAEEEEREWFFFVQALLSVAGLDGEMQSDTFLARWHSSESPIDPSLRDKYINLNDKDTLHEARRRQKRSTRKLVFDCVNAALVDIAGYGSDTCQRAIPCNGPHKTLLLGASFMMVDQVWARMKEWFSGKERCITGDCPDNDSLVVVRKEVVGKGWLDHLKLELDNLGKEIERKLLEELVLEAVVELTGRV
ncbi:hypothetical protein ACH5RR_020353 [Cinchona calisaya]|uniref:DUF3741 domain-containing protein n=1 Tax=Cinchona calisaya TaxID=153742 RepID=A0ABD2ZFE4_9GENT